MYVRELRANYRLRRVPGLRLPLERVRTIADAACAFIPLLRDEPVEVCGLLCLSVRHDVLGYHELSRGTVDATVVHPRDVFKIALLSNARAVILAHNHPSGDPMPSADDLALTQRLKTAGDVLGIDLLDHVIVGGDTYVSLKERGYL